MAKVPKNSGKRWNQADIKQLQKLADGNTPTRVIGLKLQRSADAVMSKASENNISLNPHNRSPYGTAKK